MLRGKFINYEKINEESTTFMREILKSKLLTDPERLKKIKEFEDRGFTLEMPTTEYSLAYKELKKSQIQAKNIKKFIKSHRAQSFLMAPAAVRFFKEKVNHENVLEESLQFQLLSLFYVARGLLLTTGLFALPALALGLIFTIICFQEDNSLDNCLHALNCIKADMARPLFENSSEAFSCLLLVFYIFGMINAADKNKHEDRVRHQLQTLLSQSINGTTIEEIKIACFKP